MARIKRIDPAAIRDVFEELDLLPLQPSFYSGDYPKPFAPFLTTIMAEMGPTPGGKEAFRQKMQEYRTMGHPARDTLRQQLGFTSEYTEGLYEGWHGHAPPLGEIRVDYLDGFADGKAAREEIVPPRSQGED